LAEKGDARAQHNLGLMHHHGQGIPQSYTDAANWYRRAAEQGMPDSQGNLGIMYYEGQGVSKDYVLAHIRFKLSKKN
jgi:TPR repeat protein